MKRHLLLLYGNFSHKRIAYTNIIITPKGSLASLLHSNQALELFSLRLNIAPSLSWFLKALLPLNVYFSGWLLYYTLLLSALDMLLVSKLLVWCTLKLKLPLINFPVALGWLFTCVARQSWWALCWRHGLGHHCDGEVLTVLLLENIWVGWLLHHLVQRHHTLLTNRAIWISHLYL